MPRLSRYGPSPPAPLLSPPPVGRGGTCIRVPRPVPCNRAPGSLKRLFSRELWQTFPLSRWTGGDGRGGQGVRGSGGSHRRPLHHPLLSPLESRLGDVRGLGGQPSPDPVFEDGEEDGEGDRGQAGEVGEPAAERGVVDREDLPPQ